MKISLITCTGDRPAAFRLCCKWMYRQTSPFAQDVDFRNEVPWREWIVVDDSKEQESREVNVDSLTGPMPVLKTPGVLYVPLPAMGTNSLMRNLKAALPYVRGDFIFFIEDDDWYAPDYIARSIPLLEKYGAVGERHAIYYNLPARSWRRLNNQSYSTLCNTAISREMIPAFLTAMENTPPGKSYDVVFWRAYAARGHLAEKNTGSVIGMKGMPGRAGIGVGHRLEHNPEAWTKDDENLTKLRELVGDDYNSYRVHVGEP